MMMNEYRKDEEIHIGLGGGQKQAMGNGEQMDSVKANGECCCLFLLSIHFNSDGDVGGQRARGTFKSNGSDEGSMCAGDANGFVCCERKPNHQRIRIRQGTKKGREMWMGWANGRQWGPRELICWN
jgi:hypothetical protein